MKNKCRCESKPVELCCPGDEKLRKEWLFNLEKEHEPLRQSSLKITKKLKLLSNSNRIEILLMLSLREHCMDEIARKLKARKSAISYHLGLLKKHGMICVKNRSRFAFYSLSEEGMRALETFGNI
jgi:ArsR family transcriptional regulator